MKTLLQWLYNHTLRRRRLKKITALLLQYLPEDGHILDLGCGNGEISSALKAQLPDVQFTGLDINPTPSSDVPVSVYDGINIPYPDQYFDYVMLIAMLHHTDDYLPVLREACRVSKKGLVILDHQYNSIWEWLILALIDFPGNTPFGVYTPFNFLTRSEWQVLFKQLGCRETKHDDRIYLFGKTVDCLVGKKMHFISVLEKQEWIA